MDPEYEPEYDGVFGELVYDPDLGEWRAEIPLTSWEKLDVTIQWEEERDGPLAAVLQRVREAYLRFLQREPQHLRALATAMIERFRRDVGMSEPQPTAEEIVRNLGMLRIAISSDGSLRAHYRHGVASFGDHWIVADINADGSFAGFSLQG